MNTAAGRLWRTMSQLRALQLAAQLRTKLLPGWHDPSWVRWRTAPATPAICWQPIAPWLVPEAQGCTADEIRAGRFTFVNDTRDIGWPPDWECTDAPLLWRYNLHYLEWLWSLDDASRVPAAIDWVRRHPPIRGAVGWEPYPISLRLPTLCILAAHAGEAFPELWQSIWRQAEHLSRRLEFHLLGNHLLENAVALTFVGACFDGPDARRWRDTGLRLLREQLPEQVLPDGVHFERSPMYQTRLTYALALLVNTGDPAVIKVAGRPLEAMAAALASLRHPDGEIALFNDAAFGVYHRPARVLAFAAAVLTSPFPQARDILPAGGYYRGNNERGDLFVCDAGPIGPDYLPGHAHGDIFSFELSLGGRRVIVDSGTFDYVPSDMRGYCRSTAAHNTVTVDDEDQAEMWGAFRVGRRGRPHDVSHAATPEGFTLEGWHDGYCHLSGRPVHQRRFEWCRTGHLRIIDRVAAAKPVRTAARIHLHPDCRLVGECGPTTQVRAGELAFGVRFTADGVVRREEGWYCPRFGVRERNVVLVCETIGRDARIECVIERSDDAA